MIIKVKAGQEGSWRYYDNAREVQAATVGSAAAFEIAVLRHEDQLSVSVEIEGRIEEKFFTQSPPPKECLLLSFIDHAGMPHNLYTDGECYLLNDSGKTIERVN